MPTEIFTKIGETNNLVEEFATRTEFEDDKVILPRFGKVHQAHNIRVVELSHNLYLLQDVRSLTFSMSVVAPNEHDTGSSNQVEYAKTSMEGYAHLHGLWGLFEVGV